MMNIILANFYAFIIVGFIGTVKGLDLKRWSSWLYGLYGFISGFLIGFMSDDKSGSLELGILFAFAVMFGGAMTRSHRRRFLK